MLTLVLLAALYGANERLFIRPSLFLSVSRGATPLQGSLDEGTEPASVYFGKGPITLTVSVLAGPDDRPGVTEGMKALRLAPEWWNGVTLVFEPLPVPSYPGGNDPVTYGAKDFTEIVTAAVNAKGQRLPNETILALHDKAWARFRVIAPPPGNYIVRATLDPQVTGGVDLIPGTDRVVAVRTGHENPVLYRMSLHEKAKGKPLAEYESIVLELSRLEPDNWEIWEGLANASVGKVPPEETLRHYERAYEIFSRNVARSKQPLSPEAEAQARFLTLYRTLYPTLAAHPGLAVKPIAERGVKTFAVVDRKTGKRLGKIDPAQPQIRRLNE